MMVNPLEQPANHPETAASFAPEDWPTYRAYHLEIPKGWRVLRVVFYPMRSGFDEQNALDKDDLLPQGFQRLRAGVLLCRQGRDDQEAVQEFEAGVCLEQAFLTPPDQDQQHLQNCLAYGVLPLACSNQEQRDPPLQDECLVLMPLLSFPVQDSQTVPPILLFVNGKKVA